MTHVKALQAGQSSQPGDIWAHYAGVRPDLDEFGLCGSFQQNLENRYNYHIDTATGQTAYVIVKERHETIMGYKPRERVALEWFIPIIVELLVL